MTIHIRSLIYSAAVIALCMAVGMPSHATTKSGIDTPSGVKALPFAVEGNEIFAATPSGLQFPGTTAAINTVAAQALVNLAAMSPCGSGEALSKTSATTFSCVAVGTSTPTTANTDTPTEETQTPTYSYSWQSSGCVLAAAAGCTGTPASVSCVRSDGASVSTSYCPSSSKPTQCTYPTSGSAIDYVYRYSDLATDLTSQYVSGNYRAENVSCKSTNKNKALACMGAIHYNMWGRAENRCY